jgi:hypothetical protein
MIDPNTAMVTWLQSSPDLAALVGSHVFTPYLPEGFSCADGKKAIVVRRRGGSRHPEISELLEPSFEIESRALTSLAARQIAGVVSDLVHGATSVDLGTAGFVILAQEEVAPQDLIDPETHWPMSVAYYLVKMRSGSVPLAELLPPPIVNYPFHYLSAAGVNAVSVQSVPRVVRGYRIFNNAGYPIFVKLHDTAGVPVAGSGVSRTIGVQSGRDAKEFPISIWFSQGIGMTIVKGIDDGDTTPIEADDCVVDLAYE